MSALDAVHDNATALKALILGGTDVDGADEVGRTGVYHAAHDGYVGCVKVLLEANADMDKPDEDGCTPLHAASSYGHAECVRLLTEHKANVRAQDTFGGSPLHWAAYNGRFACVEMLIRAGAEVDGLDEEGHTPLSFAIATNKPSCTELLLDAGSKMANVGEGISIPDWTNDIIVKRQNVKCSLLTFLGVLRRRLVIPNAATAPGNRIPRDMVNLLSNHVWATRFNPRWIEVQKSKDSRKKA